ncbi:MAG TPA: nicotinate-nucleotide--dimethylbenzimidazole phosphoribosyltransferase [Acidobacteriota bacterium]|nr:nicotinate-nucleotide--dimethylbenzimidazole phosphoribosyltransferase [Acidobacteriota bacterium]
MSPSLQDTLEAIQPVDPGLVGHYQSRLDQLTKPRGSLGRLEEIAARFAAIRHRPDDAASPPVAVGVKNDRDGRGQDDDGFGKKVIFTFAADHGVARRGVSLYPPEVTAQMVLNFLNGGAAINVLCGHYGITNVVVDVGVDADFGEDVRGLRRCKVARGTADLTREPAMSRQQATQALQTGIDLAGEFAAMGFQVLGTGEMGIGNTTAASAVLSALSGLDPENTTGAGTGIDGRRRTRKIELIRQALRLHRPDPADPLGVLCALGGFEIGAIAGMVLAGAARRRAVVVDGFISTAGAALALALSPSAADYLFFSHCSSESGHAPVLKWLGVRPLLELDLRLGEGTGAAIAIDLLQASWKLLTQMATFEEASVSRSS